MQRLAGRKAEPWRGDKKKVRLKGEGKTQKEEAQSVKKKEQEVELSQGTESGRDNRDRVGDTETKQTFSVT